VGFVYLFEIQNDRWEFTRALTSETATSNEYFGSALAFDSQGIIIGVPGYNNDTGAFHLFGQ
jgi:hypothetical protein